MSPINIRKVYSTEDKVYVFKQIFSEFRTNVITKEQYLCLSHRSTDCYRIFEKVNKM